MEGFCYFYSMNIETLHNYFLESSGICTDTRKITPNCLFIALSGDNFNGNTFAEEALSKGAYKVVIDQKAFHSDSKNMLLFEDSLETLQKLASFHRRFLDIPIIALTGSNGKTTTKELINAVLSEKYNTTATLGNLNNHIGVPLTLLSMNSETEIGLVEMGANHLKEIEGLCKIAKPDFGYITNFGKAHLEGFGSIQGVIQGKTELYSYLKENKKTVFVNSNDPLQSRHSEGMKCIYFGQGDSNENLRMIDDRNELHVGFKNREIQSHLIGSYNFDNIGAAIAIGSFFSISEEQIKIAIEGYLPANNRSQMVQSGSNHIILDAYNANPTSMLAALENFKQSDKKSKVLFLGDMFELGDETKKEHQEIVDYLERNKLGTCFLVGENFYETIAKSTDIIRVKTFDDLKKTLASMKIENSHLLIKASRGMALERILDLI